MLRPEEITDILRQEIENYQPETAEVNYGTVLQVGDSIARIYGLSEARAGELIKFEKGVMGIVFNLEENISAVSSWAAMRKLWKAKGLPVPAGLLKFR